MKTITKKLISTSPESYGQVLQEITIEVDDDYEERSYDQTNNIQIIPCEQTTELPLSFVLAIVAIIFALIAIW